MKVLVVGSGISGLVAAIMAVERGAKAVLVSPYASERAQSVMAAGGINAALDSDTQSDSPALHARETLAAGHYLENDDDVKALCAAAPGIIQWLESIGVVFSRQADGRVAMRAFGGQSKRRTVFSGTSTGKQIVTALTQKCREYEIAGQVERMLGWHFHSALIEDGLCYGAVFVEPATGATKAIYADATIMATGGMNRLFGKTTGSQLSDGYAAGQLLHQGVQLRNLEFIQYHPTTIETSHKLMLISEAARGEGGRLFYLNEHGARVYFMEDAYGEGGNLAPRDIVSQCMHECPSQVYLDISFLGQELIDERLAEVRDTCAEYLGIDVAKQAIPVAPAVHFFMGGIRVDAHHQTNIARLYAVGECASKYHGANRLGGNSLLAAVYSSMQAIEGIYTHEPGANSWASQEARGSALESDVHKRCDAYADSVATDMARIAKSKSKFPAEYILQELAKVTQGALGVKRSADALEAALKDIDFYLGLVDKMHFDAQVSVYKCYSLSRMLLLTKAMLQSALARCESRGAHQRSDYPATQDAFAASSVTTATGSNIHISFESDANELGAADELNAPENEPNIAGNNSLDETGGADA